MPADLPSPRWTTRRVLNTAWYAFIGAIVGPGLSFVWLGLVLIASFVLTQSSPALPFTLMLAILSSPLPYLILRSASYGTCKRHPTAPLGIAIGIAVGMLFVATPAFFSAPPWALPFIPVLAAAFGFAGFHGGQRALRESFGPMRTGIGDLCAHCGYDLSATAEGQVCPECGGIMRFEKSLQV